LLVSLLISKIFFINSPAKNLTFLTFLTNSKKKPQQLILMLTVEVYGFTS